MFDEEKHPRDDTGRFTYLDGNDGEHIATQAEQKRMEELGYSMKMTPAEKIASVHIDFDRDNFLPELNEEDLKKIGVDKNKPVLLKKNIIERNNIEHSDLTNDDFQKIISQALYSPSQIIPANDNKPYYHFSKIIVDNSKGKPEMGLALLDVGENKDNFEIVHAHFMEIPRFEKQQERKKEKG